MKFVAYNACARDNSIQSVYRIISEKKIFFSWYDGDDDNNAMLIMHSRGCNPAVVDLQK